MAFYITGDCHGDFTRFSSNNFYDGKNLTKDDYVLVLGDFGIWHDTKMEQYWFDWLAKKPFTVIFIDGNHENFDRLESGEFKTIEYHGGYADVIRPQSIYHLHRGYVYEFCGKSFFCFGGASSHDIDDGILDRNDFNSDIEFSRVCHRMTKERKVFRIKNVSWWEHEMPTEEEMQRGIENLGKVNWNVDYVMTHCAPQSVASVMSNGFYKPDVETMYFNKLLDNKLSFNRWYFGHYHVNQTVMMKFECLYEKIKRIE